MKKGFIMVAALSVFLLALSACGTSKKEDASGKTTVVAGTSGVSNPFSYEKDGKLTGYDVEVLKAIFKKLPQYKLKIQTTEFEGILTGMDNGRYQLGANNFSANKERRSKYTFSLPIIKNPNVFVVRKDDTLSSLDELKGYKAVTEVGNSGATLLENYNKSNPTKKASIIYTDENFVKQFEGIESGKYDVRIISKVSAEKAIKQYGMDDLKVVSFEDTTSDPGAYILFSQANDQKKLVAAVNKQIKALYKDGTLAKISQEQLGGNYVPDAASLK